MHRSEMRYGSRSELRLSDADREDAIVRLSEHYAAGRLDKDEFDERSDAVWTAKTRGDLAPIFADLGPGPAEAGRHHPFGTWGRRGWLPLPLGPLLLVLIVLIVLTHIPFVLLAIVGCAFVFGHRRRRYWRT
jgi:hypothetical protein